MSLMKQKNTYRYHYLDTLRMGFPIIIARTSILIMVTIDAIMTGWVGPEQLAYLGLGLAPVIALMVLFIGALNATVVLASQAIGAKEEKNVGGIWCVSNGDLRLTSVPVLANCSARMSSLARVSSACC